MRERPMGVGPTTLLGSKGLKVVCDFEPSSKAFEQQAETDDDLERAARMRELCKRLRSELAELEDLDLTLPAALLDNVIAEIEQDLSGDDTAGK